MSTNALKFTTHEGVAKVVPLDTVRVIKPMTDDDKARAKDSLKEKRGIDIDAARVNVRIEFGDKSSKLAQETLDALREQGVGTKRRFAPHKSCPVLGLNETRRLCAMMGGFDPRPTSARPQMSSPAPAKAKIQRPLNAIFLEGTDCQRLQRELGGHSIPRLSRTHRGIDRMFNIG